MTGQTTTATQPNETPLAGPGTEDQLNAVESLAESMWQATGVVLYGADWDPDGWQHLDEGFRQVFRSKAEAWIDAECHHILAEIGGGAR